MAVALISVPLILSGLGVGAFGTYALLLTFSAINGWFSLLDLGVWTAATREIAAHASMGDDEAATGVVSAAMVAVAGPSLVAVALFASIGPAVLPRLFRTPAALTADLRIAIVVFAGTIFFDLITETAQACLEGFQRVDLSRACDAFRRFGFAAATVIAALVGGGLVGVAWAGFAAAAVGAGLTVLVLRPRMVDDHSPRDPLTQRAGELLRAGRVVAVLRPLGVIERTMNRTIVGVILGPAAVTLVELASQVQNGADAVLSASSYAVVPGSSWLAAREEHGRMRELVVRGTKYAVLATTSVCVLGAMLAGPLMRLWVGQVGNESIGLARLGLLSVAMVAPIAVGSNWLLGTGRARAILHAAAAAIVVNLVVSVTLVHVMGAAGAFVGTLAANLVVVPMVVRAFLATTGVRIREFIRAALVPALAPLGAMAAAIGLVLAARLSDLATVVAGTAFGLAALAAMVWLAFLDPTERSDVADLFHRGRPVRAHDEIVSVP